MTFASELAYFSLAGFQSCEVNGKVIVKNCVQSKPGYDRVFEWKEWYCLAYSI